MSQPRARILRHLPLGSARVLSLPAAHAGAAKGFDEGYREGLACARREAEQLLEAAQARLQQERETLERDYAERLSIIERLIESFSREKQVLAGRQEQAVVTLAYEALLRVLHDAHGQRSLLARIVAQRLAEDRAGPLAIRVHPRHFARLEADLAPLLAARQDLALMADDTLSAGECLIDTPQGSEDIGLATQLDRLTAAWLAVLGQGQASDE